MLWYRYVVNSVSLRIVPPFREMSFCELLTVHELACARNVLSTNWHVSENSSYRITLRTTYERYG